MTKVTMRAIAVLLLAIGLFAGGAGLVAAQGSVIILNGQGNDNDSDQDADQDSGQFAEVSGNNASNQAAVNGGDDASSSNTNQNDTAQGNSASVSGNDISGGDDNSTTDVDITVTIIGDLIEILTAIFAGL